MFEELKTQISEFKNHVEILIGNLSDTIRLVAEGVLMNSEKIDRLREDVSDLKQDMLTVKADIVFIKSDISEIKRTYVKKKELRSITYSNKKSPSGNL
jgi:archaellum component FlaC